MTRVAGQFGRRETGQGAGEIPTRLYMEADLTDYQAHIVALEAVRIAKLNAPKFSGDSAREIRADWGHGFYGITWDNPVVWYQETGTRPHTMNSLAGKLIPMWIKDPTGEERRKNPKAKFQVGEDGVVRVLIFRRAAKKGQRKTVIRNGVQVSVPRSWPGAPGRIARRTLDGKIAKRNVGVRWRHPGIVGKGFLHKGMVQASLNHGLDPEAPVWASSRRWS